MSFVSIIATENFATIMSDGLAIERTAGGEIIKKSEWTPGFIKISGKQVVACTGNPALLRQMGEAFPFKRSNTYPLRNRMNTFEARVKQVPYEVEDVLLATVEINEAGHIECRMVSNQPGQAGQVFSLKRERLRRSSWPAAILMKKKKKIMEKFSELSDQYGRNTANKILNAQKELNRFVADMDPSVNKHTFGLTLKK
ncbi:hypothetical protein QS257_12585 [Terrilactibacillus sp. S3-3]|nr:hypothetical protein QS257_12585 [Terrilactibacillus sp. S3-3]